MSPAAAIRLKDISMASRMQNEIEKTLEEQIADLKSELEILTGKLAEQGSAVYDDVRENLTGNYNRLRRHGRNAAQEMRHQAHYVRQTARENPLATAAILAGISITLALLARR